MGYRFIAVLFALTLVTGCAAFDDDPTPYVGFSQEEINAATGAQNAGVYTGYYSGDMAVDSNECSSVTDEAGASVPLSFDVIQSDAVIEFIFDGNNSAKGDLKDDKTEIMFEETDAKTLYILTFAEDKVTGTKEVIEADENGQFGEACAKYSFELKKGDKPEEK